MSAAWKRGIAALGRDVLGPAGFTDRPNAITFEREGDGVRQGVEFQPGHGSLKDRFTINLFWTFDGEPPTGGFDFRERLGWLESGPDRWFSRADADRIVRSLETVAACLRSTVIPFLDRHRSARAILDAVDRGELDERTAFGADPGWRSWARARALAHVGERERAIEELDALAAIRSALDVRRESPGYLALFDRGQSLRARLGELP